MNGTPPCDTWQGCAVSASSCLACGEMWVVVSRWPGRAAFRRARRALDARDYLQLTAELAAALQQQGWPDEPLAALVGVGFVAPRADAVLVAASDWDALGDSRC